MSQATIILAYGPGQAADAFARAERLCTSGVPVLLAGPGASDLPEREQLVRQEASSAGEGLRAAFGQVATPITVINDPGEDLEALVSPIAHGLADAVFGRRPTAGGAWADRALGALAGWVTQEELTDPLTRVRAFRTSALSGLTFASEGDGVDAEILVKLSAQHCRILEVPLLESGMNGVSLSGRWDQARTLLRYATGRNAADDAHEGFNVLERMDGAHHYNAWVGQQLRPHLGKRVLEVGAGIGTITREIAPGRELVIALEVEALYVERLKNVFREEPAVRPYLSGVEIADWERLKADRLDTVVLSNVLEHVQDDAQAVRNFRRVLEPGGRLVLWVPALQQLFGSLDEAVGHFRRYSQESLRQVLESNGFALERSDWMNLVGIPGWWLNSVFLRRRGMPPLQLRAYDAIAPLLAKLESRVKLPIGLSLLAVARAV